MTAPSPRRTSVRELWGYSAGHRGRLAVAAALAAAGGGAALAQPLVVNRLVATVDGGGHAVGALVASFVGLVVLAAVLTGAQQRLVGDVAEEVVASVRTRLARVVYDLPVADYARFPAGDLVARFLTDSVLVRTCVTSGVVDLLGSSVVGSGATIALLVIDAPTFALSLAVSGSAIAVPLLAARRYRRLNAQIQERLAQIGDHLAVAVPAARLLRAYGATDRYARDLEHLVRRAARAGIAANHLGAVVQPASSALLQGALVVAIGIGGYRVATGALSVADLVTFLMFLSMLMAPVARVGSTVLEIQQAAAGHRRISEVLALPREGDAEIPSEDRPRQRGAPCVEFQDVTFAYPGQPPALDRVTFRVEAGSRTAVVGRSGAGKTTVCAVLERHCEPRSGRVLVDGVDIAATPRASLRSRIGYVDQGAAALRGSVRDNLDPAGRGLGDEQLHAVLRAVGLDAVVDRDPAGLDAEVGEQGALLSGGERQRLSIARALAARPDLLLLDEPTSAADGPTEQALTRTLDRLAGTCTTIIIAHRLSTVVDADQIVVLDEGRVVATGRHDELLASSEHYRSLAARQVLAS